MNIKSVSTIGLRSAVLCLAVVAVSRFAIRQTDGFSLSQIQTAHTFDPKWETRDDSWSNTEQVQEILDQPFTYLGQGDQEFTFVSKDQNYVIKFLKAKTLSPPFWTKRFVPPFLRMKARALTRYFDQKKEVEFSSYQIAYEQLKEETGLIYLHLNPSSHIRQTLTIYDKINVRHQLDPDRIVFIVQKKVDLLYPLLDLITKNREIDRGKQVITELVGLLAVRCQKGIRDTNPNLIDHFGLIDNQVVQFHIGQFSLDEQERERSVYIEEIKTITSRLHAELKEKNQELATYLEDEIQKL